MLMKYKSLNKKDKEKIVDEGDECEGKR